MHPSHRTPLVAGNWKMNLDRAAAIDLALTVARRAAGACVDVAVCPAFVHLDAVIMALQEAGLALPVGAQDCYDAPEGAFTGEISCAMLRDLGCKAALTGHSERRHVLGEDDALVARKTRAVLEAGLTCVLCIGETLEQREAGETLAVNERQLRAGLAGLDAGLAQRLVVAYEPVWAIGTGRTATPDDAQSAHEAARHVLAGLLGDDVARVTRILYGGSLKPGNAGEIFARPDVDGGLVGGASLQEGDFGAIIEAAAAVALSA